MNSYQIKQLNSKLHEVHPANISNNETQDTSQDLQKMLNSVISGNHNKELNLMSNYHSPASGFKQANPMRQSKAGAQSIDRNNNISNLSGRTSRQLKFQRSSSKFTTKKTSIVEK